MPSKCGSRSAGARWCEVCPQSKFQHTRLVLPPPAEKVLRLLIRGLLYLEPNMALVTISLPALQLRSRRDDLEVTIRGFLVLALPETLLGTDSLPVVSTIDDLENLVTEQQAWINRVGPCLLRFSSSTSSQLSHIGLSEHETRACILGSPVWEQLGLRVVDAEEDAENVVFSLQHPNLSSSLLPPKGALTVELEEVCVALDFSRTTQTKSHRRNRATGSGITSQEHQLSNGCGGAQGVNSEDLQAIEDFLSQAGIGTRERASASSSTPRRSYDRLEHCTLPKSEGNCPTLMQSAINVLLFGKQKRHVGVKWVDGEDWDGLVQLAPAVFHVPYLEVSCSNVSFRYASQSSFRLIDCYPEGEVHACNGHVSGTNGRCGVAQSAEACDEFREDTFGYTERPRQRISKWDQRCGVRHGAKHMENSPQANRCSQSGCLWNEEETT